MLLDNLGYPTTAHLAAAHIERFDQHPKSRLLVADSADALLGLVANLVLRRDDDQIGCPITDLVVLPTARRAGIGSALIAAAEAEARRAGAPRLDLSSGKWRDHAAAFYEALGFESRSRGFTKRLDA